MVGESGIARCQLGKQAGGGIVLRGIVMQFACPIGEGLRHQASERPTQEGRAPASEKIDPNGSHADQRTFSKTRLCPTLSTFVNPSPGRTAQARATGSYRFQKGEPGRPNAAPPMPSHPPATTLGPKSLTSPAAPS